MKKPQYIVSLLMMATLLLAGCTADDPLSDPLFTGGIYDNTWVYSSGDVGSGGYLYATEGVDTDGTVYAGGDITVDGSIVHRLDDGHGGYWHEYAIMALSLSPGGSGATLIITSADTLGGYGLDNATEYLYYATHIENDWDGFSNPKLILSFEINVENSGGGLADAVIIDAVCYHKSVGDFSTEVDTHSGNTVVGQATRYTLFEQEIEIDIIADSISVGDTIYIRLNLNTDGSDVNTIIINYLEFKYQTSTPAMEVN